MDPKALCKAIDLYGAPKAVVLVHLYGSPAELNEITEICREHNIILIEDAAEALGSTCCEKACSTFGKYGILSFNGNKIITTSGGGMLLCREEEDARHALKLAPQAREPFPYYQHEEIGYNYRMTNICAGIGRGQAKVLDARVAKKRYIFEKYKSSLASLPIEFQPEPECGESNRWLTSVLITDGAGVTPEDIISALSKADIEARHLWNPMHRQPVFNSAKFVSAEDDAVSTDLFMRGVCLPSDTKMSDEDIDRVCETIKSLF
jgi:dTDP-4-amino-4,6-dideoxygalactose transaminase